MFLKENRKPYEVTVDYEDVGLLKNFIPYNERVKVADIKNIRMKPGGRPCIKFNLTEEEVLLIKLSIKSEVTPV